MTSWDRQVPAPGEVFLDHVGWMVPDIDAAARAFARLGFPLTPYSLHGNRDPASGRVVPQGSANRLAVLERGYLEILTPVAGADSPVARHLRDSIARYVGVHLVAFTVADAEAEARRLAAAGFDLQPTVNLRRTAEGADGTEVEVAFTVIRAAFGSIPEGRIQTLTHLTPEHVWQPRYVARDNGLVALAEALFAVPDPLESAQRLACFTGRPAAATADGAAVALDRGRLSFLTPDGVAGRCAGLVAPPPPSIAALGFVSRDLAATRAWLTAHGVRLLADQPARLVVDPGEAMGAALIVEPLPGA